MIIPSGKSGTVGSSARITNDLIAFIDFNNDYGWAGNTANDLSDRSVKYSTPGGYVSVVSGSTSAPGYIELDGLSDYLVAGITTAALVGITSCTFDVWIKQTILTQAIATIVSNTSTGIGNLGFGLVLINTGGVAYPRFGVTSATTNIQTAQLTGLTFDNNPGQWVNLFFRVAHSPTGITVTGKVFKPNGISAADYTGVTVTTAGVTLYGNNDRALHIGRRSNAAQYFSGQIGAIKIYNRVLSTEEIETNYQRSKKRYGHS
jgi:hypothetical protein